MKTNNELFVRGGQCVYEAPTLTALYLQSEGLLCVSAPGATIDTATEEDWGTL